MAPREDGEYWNPKVETMPRDQLQRLQLVKLQRMVDWVCRRSAFYRRKYERAGVKPELAQRRETPGLCKSTRSLANDCPE